MTHIHKQTQKYTQTQTPPNHLRPDQILNVQTLLAKKKFKIQPQTFDFLRTSTQHQQQKENDKKKKQKQKFTENTHSDCSKNVLTSHDDAFKLQSLHTTFDSINLYLSNAG